MTKPPPPVTPDGRYLVVRGRLWRRSNPNLKPADRHLLVDALMAARRDVRQALSSADTVLLKNARQRVSDAKIGLGERGPAWWSDGAPDLNRHMARNTPYAAWFSDVSNASQPNESVGPARTQV